MSTLFTLNRSWHDAVWLYEQLAFAEQGDALLLIQDAVLALHSPITLGSFMAKCSGLGVTVYALKEDCELRGIASKYSDVEMVNYDDFVGLVIEHDKQVAW